MKILIALYTAAFFLVSTAYTTQAVAANWECLSVLDFLDPAGPIVKAWADLDSNIGTVEANGIIKDAEYYQQGLNHRWDFDLNESDDTYNASFVIEPTGTGKYFYFGGKDEAQPDFVTTCKKTK